MASLAAGAAHDSALAPPDSPEQPRLASIGGSTQTGIVKAVLPMHIYNLCLCRQPSKPTLILDVRSPEEFNATHFVNSYNCPVDFPAVSVEDIEKILAAAPTALQRFKNRENAIVAVLGNNMKVVEAVAEAAARDVSAGYTVIFCDHSFNSFRHQYLFVMLTAPATELPFQLKALPSEILAGQLYLGNQWTATSDDAMVAVRITAVVNCAREMENFFEREGAHGAAGIPYLRVEVDDKQSQQLMPYFNTAIEFIHSALKKGGRVLVHCAMGQSRSASVVIAYIMATKQLNADQATEVLRYVRKRKGDINPNPGFKKELKEYEKVILGDGAMVCGLPVIFESLCEKKGGGPDGQRNWFKGGRRNWKERHLRLTSRWLQYLDGPLPAGVVKGSKEVSQDWVVSFNPKHANAITLECRGSDDVFNVRFANLELCRKWKELLEEAAASAASWQQRTSTSLEADAS